MTDDLHGKSTGKVQGLASYVIRNPCFEQPSDGNDTYLAGYVIAPWVLASGTLFDTSSASEKNKLQFGLDTQFEIAEFGLPYQYLTIAPYYQTDFDWDAQIYGVQTSWTPYNLKWRLSGMIREDVFFDYYWRAQLAVDARYVDDAGNSGLTPDQAYAWLGGQLELLGWILPAKFDDNLFFKAGYAYYWDAISQKSADLLTASLGLNISKDKSTSVSLDFALGTDKDTLRSKDGVLFSLNYKGPFRKGLSGRESGDSKRLMKPAWRFACGPRPPGSTIAAARRATRAT